VTGHRELVVHARNPADVLARVREGLVRRGRWIDPCNQEGIRFRGGWALAWRTSSKPISGQVKLDRAEHELVVRISIKDAAIRAQVAMFGFERRQYEAAIGRELNEIQFDLERADAAPGAAQGGER
jgi:hypothetical protein